MRENRHLASGEKGCSITWEVTRKGPKWIGTPFNAADMVEGSGVEEGVDMYVGSMENVFKSWGRNYLELGVVEEWM